MNRRRLLRGGLLAGIGAATVGSGSQQVTNSWNATVTQSGNQVSARNAAWNATIGPGQNGALCS